jgi:hypothetical protein
LPCSFYTKKLLLLLLLLLFFFFFFFLRFLFLWLCGFFQARAQAVGIPPRAAGIRGFLHV